MGDAATKKPPQTMEEPPSELCGVWAYIKWENDGCPNRSAQESDSEYQASIRVSFQSLGFRASGTCAAYLVCFCRILAFCDMLAVSATDQLRSVPCSRIAQAQQHQQQGRAGPGCYRQRMQRSHAPFDLQELRSYLSEGVPLDELWKVAKGQVKYADFARQRKGGAPPPDKEINLPDDVVCFLALIHHRSPDRNSWDGVVDAGQRKAQHQLCSQLHLLTDASSQRDQVLCLPCKAFEHAGRWGDAHYKAEVLHSFIYLSCNC